MEGQFWKVVIAYPIAFAAWLLGGFDWLLQSLFVAVCLDVLAGVLRAYSEKRLNSSVMRRGAFRKVGYFVLVALATLLDRAVLHGAPFARVVVCSYLVATEGLSILEHLAALGVPFPASLREALEKVRDEQASHSAESKPEPQ